MQQMTAPPEKVTQARGATLELENGQEVIDAISSWWVTTHGHCPPEISQAIADQAAKLDQILFANFSHDPAEALVEKLLDFLPSSLCTAFFSDNGSTAIEVALKMALQACQQKGLKKKKKFLALEHSYHGDTVGAMSVGGRSLFTSPYESMLFSVLRAPHPTQPHLSPEEYAGSAIQMIEEHHQDLAGVIIEPLVQGTGGMIKWPKEAVQKICECTKAHDVFLIFDEVMTGFGRTGSLFAFEQVGVTPDLLCLSKGLTGGQLPLSLTIASKEIYEAFLSPQKSKMFFHGHSFTANPISCAAALANLEIFEKQGLQVAKENWQRISSIHQERIKRISPQQVSHQRVCGTIAALDLKTNQAGYENQMSEKIFHFAFKRGVFLRPLGNILYILPPYCISDEQLHLTWDVIESICSEFATE